MKRKTVYYLYDILLIALIYFSNIPFCYYAFVIISGYFCIGLIVGNSTLHLRLIRTYIDGAGGPFWWDLFTYASMISLLLYHHLFVLAIIWFYVAGLDLFSRYKANQITKAVNFATKSIKKGT